jgi:3D (Asp-Asp-Asp) domain-containing protein
MAVQATAPFLAEPPPAPGKKLGTFQLTYYWTAADQGTGKQVQLRDRQCRPLARVSGAFAGAVSVEGSGRLRDGRVITVTGNCECAGPCFKYARAGHDWGTGADDRPLAPFRSVAVDPSHVSIGRLLYIPELDGVAMPGSRPWGGFVHDGCVVAADRGSGIKGRQIDLFAASQSHYFALDRRHHLKHVTVYDGAARCGGLRKALAAGTGASATEIAVRRGQI